MTDLEKISILIPCYNESRYIRKILKKISNHSFDKEIIIIDDGSDEATLTELKSCENEKLFDKIIYHGVNKGKGAALRSGIKESTGDIILFQDSVYNLFLVLMI